MKITEALLAEHQVFHSLFDHVERVVPRLKTLPEIKAVASLLEASLKAHSDSEDDLLIAPLEHCIEQLGQAETFHDEHDEIDRALSNIQSARQISSARKLLLSAVLASRRHFDKEERFVFPLAEKTLSQQSLTKLGETWATRRRETLAV
jgi:hemerythrin-like domain-containing protein